MLHSVEPTVPGGSAPETRLREDDGRLQRGRRSRARIRRAARDLFRERGFDGATLRAIAERADMGASSIYRHVETKEELLVQELADLQEEAWSRFRSGDRRTAPVRERLQAFFAIQHELLAREKDLTVIALRATTYPHHRVARNVLSLHDRTIGLIAEILQAGRTHNELDPAIDVLAAARTLFHATSGVRISWANGLVDEEGCRQAIESAVDQMFRGIGA